MPKGNALAVTSINNILENITINDIREKEMYDSLGSIVFYADKKLDSENFERIIVIDSKENAIISAGSGTISAGSAGVLSMDFQDGRVISGTDGLYNSLSFEHMNYNLNLSADIEMVSMTGQLMGPAELKERFGESPAYIYEYAKRWSMPFSALVMAIAGLVLGSSITRGGRPFGIVLSCAVAFVFNMLFIMGENMAASMSPYLLAWMPNIIFAIPALIALKRMN
jgi:lipopolysaccharide export LptBFGC system permease protein LptF